MLLNFRRPTGNNAYKIYDMLGLKLLTRLQLGFGHHSKHKGRHNFAESLKRYALNPLNPFFGN